MADKVVEILKQVTSDTAAVKGDWVYIGGNTFNVQTDVAASIGVIEVSNDKYNAVTARDFLGDTLTALGDAVSRVESRPIWARLATVADTAAPQVLSGTFAIRKEE